MSAPSIATPALTVASLMAAFDEGYAAEMRNATPEVAQQNWDRSVAYMSNFLRGAVDDDAETRTARQVAMQNWIRAGLYVHARRPAAHVARLAPFDIVD